MSFNNLLGNDSQKEILLNTVKDGRLGHSYIFSGPSGVGKKLFAIEFAKLINCTVGIDRRKDDCSCSSCSKIEKMIHPDVCLFEYEGQKTIKIDQIRTDIEKRIFLSPFESRHKIFIIDDAERMNINAQNAFLKTLEEPPADSIIILVTESINFIIPTIKSRCQILNFSPVESENIKSMLQENPGLDTSDIDTAMKLSRGSIGKALNLDSEQIEFRNEVTKLLNSVRPDKPSSIFTLYELIKLDSKDNNPDQLKSVFGIISDWLRDLILIKIDYGKNALVNTDMYTELAEYASQKSLSGLLKKTRHLESSWYGITVLNANKRLAFEDLMIKLSA